VKKKQQDGRSIERLSRRASAFISKESNCFATDVKVVSGHRPIGIAPLSPLPEKTSGSHYFDAVTGFGSAGLIANRTSSISSSDTKSLVLRISQTSEDYLKVPKNIPFIRQLTAVAVEHTSKLSLALSERGVKVQEIGFWKLTQSVVE
jgi:hypothetical protein